MFPHLGKKHSLNGTHFHSFNISKFPSKCFLKCYIQPLRNFSSYSHTPCSFLAERSHRREGEVSWFPASCPVVPWRPAIHCLPLAWKHCTQDHSQRKWDLMRLIHKYFLAKWNTIEWHSPHQTTKHGRYNPRRHITWALKGIIWGGTVGLCRFARDLNKSWFCGKREKTKERKEREYFGLW